MQQFVGYLYKAEPLSCGCSTEKGDNAVKITNKRNNGKENLNMARQWYTYLVRCNDNSLYAGVTTDLSRRLSEHNSQSLGAKYTRNKRPVKLVYFQFQESRSDACKYEYQLKQLNKSQKESLVSAFCQEKLLAVGIDLTD